MNGKGWLATVSDVGDTHSQTCGGNADSANTKWVGSGEGGKDTRLHVFALYALPILMLGMSCCGSNYASRAPQISPPAPVYPISVADRTTAPVAFKKVVFTIPPGTHLGSHYDARIVAEQLAGGVKLHDHTWQESVTVGDEQFSAIVEKELLSAGYDVAGATSLLFDQEDDWRARKLLGAKITGLRHYTYGQYAGNRCESSVDVEWQVLDKTSRKIDYAWSNTGRAQVEGTGGTASIFAAFRNAARDLLADAGFVQAMNDAGAEAAGIGGPRPRHILKTDSLPPFESQEAMVARVQKSVVTLKTEGGHASGIVVSTDGFIVTNHHAVGNRHFPDVTFNSGLTLQAEVVISDADCDLALLKVQGTGYQALPLTHNAVLPGQEVLAVGAPYSVKLSSSVTKGIVSGLRTVNGSEYIQTDVAVSPGNSGGPLVDKRGYVLGMVAWKIVVPGFVGLAFCIPANEIRRALGLIDG